MDPYTNHTPAEQQQTNGCAENLLYEEPWQNHTDHLDSVRSLVKRLQDIMLFVRNEILDGCVPYQANEHSSRRRSNYDGHQNHVESLKKVGRLA